MFISPARAVVSLTTAVIALSGCSGGEDGPGSRFAAERREVRDAVGRFYDAIGSKDAAAACRQLSQGARRDLKVVLEQVSGASGCTAAMQFVIDQRETVAATASAPKIERILSRDDGLATVTLSVEGGPLVELPLVRQGGRWKIAAALPGR